MSRNRRKEVTMAIFEGVSEDGGFIFEVSTFPCLWKQTMVKLTAYTAGIAEIAIDYEIPLPKVAEIVAGMFAVQSTFSNLDLVILNYCDIRLEISKYAGRKNIIHMLMKAMAEPEYKKVEHAISVDMQVCQKNYPLKSSDCLEMPYLVDTKRFRFYKIFQWGKELWFMNPYEKHHNVEISSIKDGIVVVEPSIGSNIVDFVKQLKNFFMPYSNMYGVKAIEVSFNEFSIRMDENNAGRILELFHRSLSVSIDLYERELQEYYNSPKYIRDHAKFLKKDCRKKTVIQKVRDFQKNTDFTIVDKKKQAEWENCKAINSKHDYSNCIIDYTILWAQYMEYLMAKHDQKISDVWNRTSHSADIYGITGNMYGCAVGILSYIWKYGEELRLLHNARYNHHGAGVVNPAVLTLSV